MWDGFENKGRAFSVLSHFDTISSFDMLDCENYGMTYIPLFAESNISLKRQRRSTICLFVGPFILIGLLGLSR